MNPNPNTSDSDNYQDARDMASDIDPELAKYLQLLGSTDNTSNTSESGEAEQTKTTPLFTWDVKKQATSNTTGQAVNFVQYAVLGSQLSSDYCSVENSGKSPVFLNVNAPWSAFICGSQGSGKSHTLSCMLESCLYPNPNIGQLRNPLTGIVFNFDAHCLGTPCEAAYLASKMPVNVLVSPSNFWKMDKIYKALPVPENSIKVYPLLLQDKHLNVERMRRLMACNDKDGAMPLCIEVMMSILRDMAIESKGEDEFSFRDFRRHIENNPNWAAGQKAPMTLRLKLLGSFIDTGDKEAFENARCKGDLLETRSGTLTIVDLTDPFLEPSSACLLFDICLAIFLGQPADIGKIVALDEAHKFMTETDASDNFTSSLLTVVREQRHKGARVVVATQEPTISPKLLDLCSMTIVHRFTSPEWLATLQSRLAAASSVGGMTEAKLQEMFKEIVSLKVGEALLFSPSALLDIVDGHVKELGVNRVKFKTRQRLTADGGKSIMAA